MTRRKTSANSIGLARAPTAVSPAVSRDPVAAILGIGEADDGRDAFAVPLWQAFLFFERWCAVELPRVAAMGDG
jgi:hypothetical protein